MPRKRLDVVVRAFARLNTANARLVVAGEDRGALAEMRRGLKKVGVEKQTVLTGLLAGNDRYRALADADVVVYPSEKEVFGLVALEAILCGTPVVVADDGGCGEVLKQVGGGLTVPVGDSHALAAAMDRILQNGESGRGEARSAQSQVRRLFATEVVVGRLETVYGEVLGMAPPHW